jgi:hypothetical protein
MSASLGSEGREKGEEYTKNDRARIESSATQEKKEKKHSLSACIPPLSSSPPPPNRGSSRARECRSVTRFVGCTDAMSEANSVFCGC